MNRYACAIAITLICSLARAQPNPQTDWTRIVGGAGTEIAYAVGQTPDGGFLAAGETDSPDETDKDFYVVKLDSGGAVVWTRTFGGAYDDVARSLVVLTDGSFVIAGYTVTNSGGPPNVYLAKLDGNGSIVWARTSAGIYNERAFDVTPTNDGGFVVTGRSDAGGTFDIYLRKTNTLGNPIWTHWFNRGALETGYSVRPTLDGGYVVAAVGGWTEGDGYLLKTSSGGNQQWLRTFHASTNQEVWAVRTTRDSGYVFCGALLQFFNNVWVPRLRVTKTNADGVEQWNRTMNDGHDRRAYAIEQLADRGYVAGGTKDGDVALVKLDSTGTVRWERTFGGPDEDAALAMQLTRDGGYVLAGYTDSYEARGRDVYVVKTGPDRLPVDDEPELLPAAYALDFFPNPFNATATLSFQLPRAGQVSIRLFDLHGRAVQTLSHDWYAPGAHRLLVNAEGLPGGLYFVRLETSEFACTQKVLLVK